MKAPITPQINPRSGAGVREGNVYTNKHGQPFYKVVLAIIKNKRYNNVAYLHIVATGDIVGVSMQPAPYLSDRHDPVGQVPELPGFKVNWLTEDER